MPKMQELFLVSYSQIKRNHPHAITSGATTFDVQGCTNDAGAGCSRAVTSERRGYKERMTYMDVGKQNNAGAVVGGAGGTTVLLSLDKKL